MSPELAAIFWEVVKYLIIALLSGAIGGIVTYSVWLGKSVVRIDRDKLPRNELQQMMQPVIEQLRETVRAQSDAFGAAVAGLRAAVDKQFDSNIEVRDEVHDFKEQVAGELGEVKGALKALQNRQRRNGHH